MERKTLFFSSLMARGSSAVGGSMAMKARIWKRWVTTMSLKAPVALVEGGPVVDRQGLGHVDLDVVDVLAVPDGLEEPLAKRKARMFWAASLPRKWSMRKTWSSSKTSCTHGVERLGAGQVGAEGLLHDHPDRSTSPASESIWITASVRRRGDAQVVQSAGLAAHVALGLGHVLGQRLGPRRGGAEAQPLLEVGPLQQ
jgi:hypothetical protein